MARSKAACSLRAGSADATLSAAMGMIPYRKKIKRRKLVFAEKTRRFNDVWPPVLTFIARMAEKNGKSGAPEA
jgi:hypothetical protein